MTTAARPEKDLGIETLRGLAIILVAAGHVIGMDSKTGMEVGDQSGFRFFYYCFQDIRMPLFTVISGFVYSLRPFSKGGSIPKFLKGKATRILLPMVVVSTLQFLVKALVEKGPRMEDMWRIYFFPYGQFWFLQSIMIIFIVVMLLDWAGWIDAPWKILTALGLSIAYRIYEPFFSLFFSSFQAGRLLPFFLLGCLIQRAPSVSRHPFVIAGSALVFACGYALRQVQWWVVDAQFPMANLVRVAVGVTAAVLLFRYRRNVPLLARMGSYAYTIFLFHIFATAGVLSILPKLGIHNMLVLFFVSLLAGLVFPIVVDHLCRLHRLPSLLFLGLKIRPPRKPEPAVT